MQCGLGRSVTPSGSAGEQEAEEVMDHDGSGAAALPLVPQILKLFFVIYSLAGVGRSQRALSKAAFSRGRPGVSSQESRLARYLFSSCSSPASTSCSDLLLFYRLFLSAFTSLCRSARHFATSPSVKKSFINKPDSHFNHLSSPTV